MVGRYAEPNATVPTVAILLSSYNGARYLDRQLASLLGQTHTAWHLFWRDDGSTDDSVALLRRFAAAAPGRCTEIPTDERLGLTRSFLRLLAEAAGSGATHLAFCDQDDVWLPDKLARGITAMRAVAADAPTLYCASHIAVDAALRPRLTAAPLRRPPGFPASLTHNIAAGCTIVLNRPAVALILASAPPADTLHDWWSYLVVSSAGGTILADSTPVLLYRQHGGNAVGIAASMSRRAWAALRRGPVPFMRQLRDHVRALRDRPHTLSPPARQQLDRIARALAGGPLAKALVLRTPGLRRQTGLETLVFRLWFLLG